MKLIVGLGNPGRRYEWTRHNAGKLLMALIAEREGVKFSRKKDLKSFVGDAVWGEAKVLLAAPETYMNHSGEAVAALVRYWGIDIEQDLLIAVDDLALPFGRLRMRPKGSPGGHNGLGSVSLFLESHRFSRLRIGIGHPQEYEAGKALDTADYVLSRFFEEERKELPAILERAADACRIWSQQSVQDAMNFVNSVV